MRRAALIAAAAAVAVVPAAVSGWMLLGPGPLDFAGKPTVPLADYSGPDPTGVPASLRGADIIARGRYLAAAADCGACHTIRGQPEYSGGLAFNLPFGTLYAPNITPDKETGIGAWSDADFLRALHQGIAANGERLYPAFPYAAYAYMTDADVLAIKAYLFSLPPVRRKTPPNTFVFPFNQRWSMAFWSFFFNPDERFRPNTTKTPEWNRGAYLAEAMAHCGDCHTPRNLAQGLDNRQKFKGATAAGWNAYNITPDSASGIGAWSDDALMAFLETGHADGYGTASGPMGEAIDNGLKHLAAEDIAALVEYLRSVPAIPSPDLPAPRQSLASTSPKAGSTGSARLGASLFAGACASCHGWTGKSPVRDMASLTGGRAVNDPTARNVAQTIIGGVVRDSEAGLVRMPAFGQTYSDIEIAEIANYVVGRFGAAPSSITADQVAKLRTEASQ